MRSALREAVSRRGVALGESEGVKRPRGVVFLGVGERGRVRKGRDVVDQGLGCISAGWPSPSRSK